MTEKVRLRRQKVYFDMHKRLSQKAEYCFSLDKMFSLDENISQ